MMPADVSAPLLSRFDLIMVLTDTPDLAWDRTVSEFILTGRADQAMVKKVEFIFASLNAVHPTFKTPKLTHIRFLR